MKTPHSFEPIEWELHRQGYKTILSLDEAGRGPLAGPVTIGGVIFLQKQFPIPPDHPIQGINDSKKLSEKRRESFKGIIRDFAAFYGVIHINNRLIDRHGINPATRYGVERMIDRARIAGFTPDMVIMDGNYNFARSILDSHGVPFQTYVKGDSRSISIAAASILAKVSRDHRMVAFDSLFPGYGLAGHKGYGTKAHREAIQKIGPAPIHRRSYSW